MFSLISAILGTQLNSSFCFPVIIHLDLGVADIERIKETSEIQQISWKEIISFRIHIHRKYVVKIQS